jgi:uncharacterized protein (DUF2147 family)
MRVAAFAVGLACLTVPALAQNPDPSGIYVSESGRTRVRVAKCGPTHCGRIISVVGQTKDLNNPDPGKRERDLVGLQMRWDIKPARDGFTGQLYNFRDGKTYSGQATFDGRGMKLSGCILGGLICRSQIWTRVE